MSSFLFGACSADGKTLEQLQTEDCPPECQSLYDDVLSKCTPGVDKYQNSTGGAFNDYIYQEAVLYHEEGRKWSSCNYGYTPTACEKAVRDLEVARRPEENWSPTFDGGPRPVPAVCVNDDDVTDEPCSDECKAYIDTVVQACDADPNAMFAPDGTFSDDDHQRIAWESPKALENMGLEPSSFSTYLTMPETCWDYYTESAAAVNPNFGVDDGLLPPFGSQACQEETAVLDANEELENISNGLLFAALFTECDFEDPMNSGGCDISFSDAELSDYKAACEKGGGKLLTFDYSSSCAESNNVESNTVVDNFPVCIGSSCDAKEACDIVGAPEFDEDPSCTNKVTDCRTTSSSSYLSVLNSALISSAAAVFLLQALL